MISNYTGSQNFKNYITYFKTYISIKYVIIGKNMHLIYFKCIFNEKGSKEILYFYCIIYKFIFLIFLNNTNVNFSQKKMN